MTVIAACSVTGVMASDSHWVDTTDRGAARKVFRIRGELFGFAGNLDEIQTAVDTLRAGEDPRGVPTIRALILAPSGLYTWDPTNGRIRLLDKQYAIGTGGQAARAAMMMGATPAKAVAVTCSIDANCSGRARVYKLNPSPRAPYLEK